MAKELQKKTQDDLIKDLSARRESLKTFRFAVEGSKTRNVREGRNLRKEISRVLTEMNSRSKK